jgi:chloride channel protein, CIC family
MRPDVRSVPAHTTVSRFRMVFPLGSTTHVVAVNEEKGYAGIVSVAEAHAIELDESTVIRDILHYPDIALLPTMTVKEAVTIFESPEAEALAVIQSSEKRRVIGLLTESYALRRYSEGLELRRRELIGD